MPKLHSQHAAVFGMTLLLQEEWQVNTFRSTNWKLLPSDLLTYIPCTFTQQQTTGLPVHEQQSGLPVVIVALVLQAG